MKKKNQKIFLTGLKQFLLVSLDVLVMLLTAVFLIGLYFYFRTPMDIGPLSHEVYQTSIIYDRTGEHVLYEIHGEENRKVIAHDQIPDILRLATIAAEDERFYSHNGIDFTAIMRAVKTDVENNQIQQGASTITQQLARNAFLTRDKNFRRKILEIILAIKIENKYTKDEILDMYLNEIPYGANAYGIQSAAETFFGKNASELTLDEAALLAALPNAPTTLSPYGNNTKELIRRKNKILNQMKEQGVISEEQAQTARAQYTVDKIIPQKQSIKAPHFVFYVREQLEKKYGQEMIQQGGLRIYTTLDYDIQRIAEQIIEKKVEENKQKYQASNASLVAINPKNGQIIAMVGSKNYFDKTIDGQVNVSISPRQPGSSFKPFAYAKAFEKGYYPENLIYDIFTNFGPDGSGQDYIPNNYDGNFHGLVSMRQALAMSLNIPAVKTLYLAGIEDTIELAHRLGISTLQDKNRYGLALVLGGGEVTLLDETSAFSVFANDGKKNPATGILKIVNNQGQIIEENKVVDAQVIHQQIARKINSILSDNNARSPVFGTDNKLHLLGRTVAAKTGTTQEFRDAWTIGYTPSLACGVWTGNNDNSTMKNGADGSYVAAPIWHEFMSQVLKNYPEETFPDYDRSEINKNISYDNQPKMVYYNKKSGKKLSEKKLKKTDPDKVEIRYEFSPAYQSSSESGIPLVIEMQNTNDPMILRWKNTLKNPTEYTRE